MTFGGIRFQAVVMIGPEYSTESTLKALETYAQGGGKLLLDGSARRDFNGNETSDSQGDRIRPASRPWVVGWAA